MALHVGHNCNPWEDCDVCGAKVEPPYSQRTDVCAMCRQGFTLCRCRHQLREWKEKQAMTDMLDDIKTKWNIPVVLPMTVPWGKDDVVWLVGEIERLRTEARRADEEATTLANSDLATTEQVLRFKNTVIRSLRADNERLRAELDEALRLLATRVEAKRLDDACAEVAALREACTLALGIMEQKNRVAVLPTAKFVDVKFVPEDVAVLRAALEKKS